MKRHKYNAVPTYVNGIRFASKAEAKRYAELLILENAGKITNLGTQHEYPLFARTITGASVSIGKYVSDFRYFDNEAGRWTTEDVKGMRTPLYKWKKKHAEAQYGIKIVEIK